MRGKYLRRHHRRKYRRRRAAGILLLCAVLIFLAAHASCFTAGGKQPLFLFPDGEAPQLCVYLHKENMLREMPLDSYLLRAVAAEMPASFHIEALRAQAVASRSYVCFRLRALGGSGCASHPQADVCTDYRCCQAYLHEDTPVDPIIARAISDTCGEVLTYDGAVINALYHACSGGYTANSQDVFSAALPYLKAVSSPNEENYPQYSAHQDFSSEYLASVFPIDADLPLEGQFQITFDAHGRASSVTAGGKTYRGSEFRRLLSLPSARISLSFSDSKMHISTTGYGHGVGMSQVGADAMARRGADYREILKWYYSGCVIDSLI